MLTSIQAAVPNGRSKYITFQVSVFKKFVRHWGYFHLVSSFLLIKDFQFFFSPGIHSFKFLFNRLKFKMLQSYSGNSKVMLVVINFIKLKRIGCWVPLLLENLKKIPIIKIIPYSKCSGSGISFMPYSNLSPFSQLHQASWLSNFWERLLLLNQSAGLLLNRQSHFI